MVYFNNVPQPTDKPSQSQAQIASNFSDLDTVFNKNHIGFSQANNRGEHRKVTFNSVIANPNAASPKANLYIKTVAGASQLFYQNGNAASNVKQMTGLNITNLVNGGTAGGTLYRITDPLGFTIYCGKTNVFGSITFPVAYTTIFSAQATRSDGNDQIFRFTTGLGALQISSVPGGGVGTVDWFAMGKI